MTQQANPCLFPLTSGQSGVWFDQMLHPDRPLYNMAGYLQIGGPIDRHVFDAALQILIQQHDALRIVLRPGQDLPRQEILPDVKVPLGTNAGAGRGVLASTDRCAEITTGTSSGQLGGDNQQRLF